MNTTKKLFCLFAFTVFVMMASAQGKQSSVTERIKQGIANLKSTLALSDAQVTQLEQLNISFHTEMDAITKKKLDNKVKGEQMKALFDAREAKLKQIFTDKQYKDYQNMLAQKRQTVPVKKSKM